MSTLVADCTHTAIQRDSSLPVLHVVQVSKHHSEHMFVQIVNCAGLVSKWVGDTPKNIDALFQEARASDAVLCFDEAEGLFGTRSSDMGSSTDRYAAMDVGKPYLLS